MISVTTEIIVDFTDDCNFDDDSSPMCHWRNIGNELKFLRHAGSTMSHSTGPSGDHSQFQSKRF